MGYLKNTINVQHAVTPLVFPAPDSPIVDQTTKSVELLISSVVPADRKIFCAPNVGTDTFTTSRAKTRNGYCKCKWFWKSNRNSS